MTNREFFIKTLETEMPVFLKVIKAVPKDKFDYKGHERGRPVGHITIQLSRQPVMISDVVNKGVLDFTVPYDAGVDKDNVEEEAEKTFSRVLADLRKISDDDWENGEAKMVWEGGEWKTKKYDMAWGMLFDAIHHRGQLSIYIRILGGKVPGIYGGSADEKPPGM